MTPEAKKRCEELGWKSWPNLWAHASQRLAFEEGYKVGMQDPDAGKIVPTKSGSHVMVAKELWEQMEQERIANNMLLEECEKGLEWMSSSEFPIEKRGDKEFMRITIEDVLIPKSKELLQKLKAARGEK